MALIASIALALALTLVGFGSAASAQAPAYPSTAILTTDVTIVAPCGTVIVIGTGFLPNHEITLTISGKVIGTTTSDAEGNFTFPYKVPCDTAPGPITISATDGTTLLSVAITVSSSTATTTGTTTTGTLPRTGSSSTQTLVRIGVLLVATGGLLLLGANRRKRHAGVATHDS